MSRVHVRNVASPVLRLGARLILLAASALRAQQPAPPLLPPGPLIQQRAPEMAYWSVTKAYGSLSDAVAKRAPTSASGAKPDQPPSVKINLVKTGDIMLVQRVDASKEAWNTWRAGGLEFVVWPDGKQCIETGAPNQDLVNPFFTDFSTSDFPGFDWISLQNYTDHETLMGFTCIVFKSGSKAAYVDIESRLPIALVDLGQASIYEWKAPPQAMLTLPAVVQAQVRQRQKAAAQMAQPAERPF
jgi:hypothetical protein